MSPFFANHGYHLRTGAEPPRNAPRHPEAQAADRLIRRTEAVRLRLQDKIAWAQEEQERHANRRRTPHPEYRIGDLVYVNARDFAPEHMLAVSITPVFHP
jgi:hypothetical protein